MRHNEGSGTFRHSYLNQTVEHDMIAAILNEVSQASLLQKLSHAGHARDRRAKKDMVPPEVWETLKKKGEAADIEEMVQRRDSLRAEAKALTVVGLKKKELGKEADRLTRRINSRRATEKTHVISRYHDFYFKTAPTRDLNRQLNGEPPLEYTPPVIECQLPEHSEVAHLLSEQRPDNLDDEQLRALRIQVCSLYVRLGRLREPARPHVKQFLAKLGAPARKSSSPSPVPEVVDKVASPKYYSGSPSPSSPSPSLSPASSPSPITPTSSWAGYPDVSGVCIPSHGLALSESSYNSQFYTCSDSQSYQYQAPPLAYAAPVIPPQETWNSTLQYALGYPTPAQAPSYSCFQNALVSQPLQLSSYTSFQNVLGPSF